MVSSPIVPVLVYYSFAGRSGLVVARFPAAQEGPGSNMGLETIEWQGRAAYVFGCHTTPTNIHLNFIFATFSKIIPWEDMKTDIAEHSLNKHNSEQLVTVLCGIFVNSKWLRSSKTTAPKPTENNECDDSANVADAELILAHIFVEHACNDNLITACY